MATQTPGSKGQDVDVEASSALGGTAASTEAPLAPVVDDARRALASPPSQEASWPSHASPSPVRERHGATAVEAGDGDAAGGGGGGAELAGSSSSANGTMANDAASAKGAAPLLVSEKSVSKASVAVVRDEDNPLADFFAQRPAAIGKRKREHGFLSGSDDDGAAKGEASRHLPRRSERRSTVVEKHLAKEDRGQREPREKRRHQAPASPRGPDSSEGREPLNPSESQTMARRVNEFCEVHKLADKARGIMKNMLPQDLEQVLREGERVKQANNPTGFVIAFVRSLERAAGHPMGVRTHEYERAGANPPGRGHDSGRGASADSREVARQPRGHRRRVAERRRGDSRRSSRTGPPAHRRRRVTRR